MYSDYLKKYLKNRKFRLAAIISGFAVITFFGGLELTAQPGLCSMCHMMKPEYYTWQWSSHSDTGCTSCHVSPGLLNSVKSRLAGAGNLYRMLTDSYVSPIVKLSPISDRACEQCHKTMADIKGDKVRPAHEVHKKYSVNCTKCHRGIAHGKIAERGVTFQSDYSKWDDVFGESLMTEKQFTAPDMDDCFRCHRLRNGPIECKACHTGSVEPESHQTEEFKNSSHGKTAATELNYCDNCHQYMSTLQTQEIEQKKKYLEFLKQGEGERQRDMVTPYSRTNTFCRDCHARRPPSHRDRNITTHGIRAEKDQKRCMTCHDNQFRPGAVGEQPGQKAVVTEVFCAKCHPSAHKYSLQWKNGYHPTDLPAKPRIVKSCYTCHAEKTCGRCHGSLQ